MRGSKSIAIGASVLFVLAVSLYWYQAVNSFNPFPQTTTVSTTTTCSAAVACPGFKVTSASLSIRTLSGVTSQELTIEIVPSGDASMARVEVFLDNVSLGVVEGPFAPGVAKELDLGVPTTISISAGLSYHVVVEGVYVDSKTGLTVGDYWQSLVVVAG